MDEAPFPVDALEFLQHARYDVNATRALELMSMSFHWSDEKLREVGRICRSHESYAHFAVMEFRMSLIMEHPIEHYRSIWNQLSAACPNWPGFRPERCSPSLLKEWEREKRRTCVAFDRDLRKLETESRDTAQ